MPPLSRNLARMKLNSRLKAYFPCQQRAMLSEAGAVLLSRSSSSKHELILLPARFLYIKLLFGLMQTIKQTQANILISPRVHAEVEDTVHGNVRDVLFAVKSNVCGIELCCYGLLQLQFRH